MKMKIIAVGKIKETFFDDAIKEYLKRLTRYCKLEIIQVTDEKTEEKMSDVEQDMVLKKEAERILKNVKDDTYLITLEIKGETPDSEKLAKKIEDIGIGGQSEITFVIGGSLGLHSDVTRKANYKLSFSKMTFPHQLMRVILLEQIYRSFRIINGEPYHK